MTGGPGDTGAELELVAASPDGGPVHSEHGFDPAIETDTLGAYALTRVKRLQPDGGVRFESLLWSARTGSNLPGGWIALHPDGEHALRRDPDHSVRFCEIASGRAISLLDPRPMAPPAMAGGHAVWWVRDSVARDTGPVHGQVVYDLRSGEKTHELSGSFLLASLAPQGQLITVDESNALIVWNVATGRPVTTLRGPREKPLELRVDPARRRAVVVGSSGTLWVWDLDAERLVATHDAHAKLRAGPPRRMVVLADGRLASEGFFLDVLDLDSGVLDRSWIARDPNSQHIHAVAALGTAPYVALLVARGIVDPFRLEIWDVDRQVLVGVTDVEGAQTLAICAGDLAVLGGDAGVRAVRIHLRRGPLPRQPVVPAAVRTKLAKAAKPAPKKPAVRKSAATRPTRKPPRKSPR
jgi:WD40 repeat protein